MQKKTDEQELTQKIEIIVEAIRNQKGYGITDIDIAKINTTVCRHYVICEAPSHVQVKAIAKEVEDELLKRMNKKPYHKEGFQNGYWILLNYADVIVHVFQTVARDFYKLEELWADGIIKKYKS